MSSSDTVNKLYGIGMATGYYNTSTKVASSQGTIENYGTIVIEANDKQSAQLIMRLQKMSQKVLME